MDLPSERAIIKRDVKKVCRRCRFQFNSGRAHACNMKMHYKDGTTVTRRKGRSKTKINTSRNENENISVDQANALSFGLKILGKRGSKGVNVNKREISTIDEDDKNGYEYLIGGNDYDGDNEHEDKSDKDEEEDEDNDRFNLMQNLRNYNFRENTHEITSSSVFICKTCDMHFPTYHAALSM